MFRDPVEALRARVSALEEDLSVARARAQRAVAVRRRLEQRRRSLRRGPVWAFAFVLGAFLLSSAVTAVASFVPTPDAPPRLRAIGDTTLRPLDVRDVPMFAPDSVHVPNERAPLLRAAGDIPD